MRLTMTAAAAVVALLTVPAFAATTTDSSNPAIKTTDGNNAGAPAEGANSFTMGQAKARIESRGYGQVSALKKNKTGIWSGKAMKDGKPVNVELDFQGNVVTN